MGNPYVVYYGWLTDDAGGEPNDEARRIAAARPPLLIAHLQAAAPDNHLNLSTQVLALLRAAGTGIFGYVSTDFGRAGLDGVRHAVADNLDTGLDGIFFDESDSMTSTAKFGYYTMLAQPVRQQGRKVVLNSGVSKCGERIMEVADLLMVEHEWRQFPADSPWMAKYGAERFMGISSNEEGAMGYSVDARRAVDDTREAWRAGVGWHAATDRYVVLPDWFETHLDAVRQ